MMIESDMTSGFESDDLSMSDICSNVGGHGGSYSLNLNRLSVNHVDQSINPFDSEANSKHAEPVHDLVKPLERI